jgi:diaminopropionate ammonia-lyase
MPLSHFRQPPKILAHVRNAALTGPYPQRLEALFPRALTDRAVAEICQWPGYEPTPLRSLDRLAGALGLGAVLYKDESGRFGLGSFKALGGAYAVIRLLSDKLGLSMADIRSGRGGDAARAITVTTATDGNHGRSVAWGARQAGCRCRVYIHANVSQARVRAIEDLGAEVVRTAGHYDDSVHTCARESAENGWFVVSDTSWDGYLDVPRQVMAGYATMAVEAMAQAASRGDGPITHVFVQAGVGGLAAALAARMWMATGPGPESGGEYAPEPGHPHFVIIESEYAACLMKSARQGRPATVKIRHETVMAGMSCGEVSLIAWEILRRAASNFVTIADAAVAPTMRMLASGMAGGGEIEAGECSAPGPAALIAAACDQGLRREMRLDANSQVLVIGSEGATDPAIYAEIQGAG